MLKSKKIALLTAALTMAVTILLLVERGGLIAWGGFALSAALLAKIWFAPSKFDTSVGVGLAMVLGLAWAGTLYYVITTYESGEVVELAIDTSAGAHTARLWVLDIGANPIVYYDAEPEVAASLLAGKPLRFKRDGVTSTRVPKTRLADSMPADDASKVLEVMTTKYANRMLAVDVFYLMLGRSRDRVAVVAELTEP